jgi:hypothetical protein
MFTSREMQNYESTQNEPLVHDYTSIEVAFLFEQYPGHGSGMADFGML